MTEAGSDPYTGTMQPSNPSNEHSLPPSLLPCLTDPLPLPPSPPSPPRYSSELVSPTCRVAQPCIAAGTTALSRASHSMCVAWMLKLRCAACNRGKNSTCRTLPTTRSIPPHSDPSTEGTRPTWSNPSIGSTR